MAGAAGRGTVGDEQIKSALAARRHRGDRRREVGDQKRSLAVTGSVNQLGNVRAIGGVIEKIQGVPEYVIGKSGVAIRGVSRHNAWQRSSSSAVVVRFGIRSPAVFLPSVPRRSDRCRVVG